MKCASFPLYILCLFKTNSCPGSPGGAALFAHAVVLGSRVPVPHHPARPPLLPAVHHPLCLRARVTLQHGKMKPQLRGTSTTVCAVQSTTSSLSYLSSAALSAVLR